MKNLNSSELVAKEVVALDNGQILGYVLGLCFDGGASKLSGFMLADEDSEWESFLPIKHVKNFGQDCLFIDNASCLENNFAKPTFSPIGKKVYDEFGNFLGRVIDVVFDKNKLSKIVTNFCELPNSYIYSHGVDCIFFGKRKSKKKAKLNRYDFKNNQTSNKVEIQASGEPQENSISKYQIGQNKNQIVVSPDKLMLAPSTLLNKTSTCDIYGLNNELIIKKGQIITSSKIDKAKKHGKINLLILNSK